VLTELPLFSYNPFHSQRNFIKTLIQSGGGTGPMMPSNQLRKWHGANSWEQSTDENVTFVYNLLFCVERRFFIWN